MVYEKILYWAYLNNDNMGEFINTWHDLEEVTYHKRMNRMVYFVLNYNEEIDFIRLIINN